MTRKRRILWTVGAIALGAVTITGVWIGRIMTATSAAKPWLVRELRTEFEAIPESERAWPIYRATLGALHEGRRDHYDYEPRDREEWPAYREWLRARRPQVDAIVAATSLPHLGLPWGSAELWSVGDQPSADPMAEWAANQSTAPSRLVRDCYRILRSDAYLALEDGDLERALTSFHACIRFVAQCERSRMSLIQQLTTAACRAGAIQVASALVRDERFRTTEHLNRLDSILAELPSGAIRFAEEMPFQLELLDALYAAEGWGGGRLTTDAIEESRQALDIENRLGFPSPGANLSPEEAALSQPSLLIQLFAPSREEAAAQTRRILETLDSLARIPAHQRPDPATVLPAPLPLQEAIATLQADGPRDSLLLVGDFSQLDRDALRLAIAILRDRITLGHWPEPGSHAGTPDPLTGSPLRWVVRGGELLVYSVGCDRIDDGGTAIPLLPDDDPRADWKSYFGQETFRSRKGDVIVLRVAHGD